MEVYCKINGQIKTLKAEKEATSPDSEMWNVFNNVDIIAQLIRAGDVNGKQVWGSRIPTPLNETQMYWIGVQITLAA